LMHFQERAYRRPLSGRLLADLDGKDVH